MARAKRLLVLAALGIAPAGAARAHTDRYSFSDFVFEDRRVLFTLRTTVRDVADVVRIDANGDGDISKEELTSGGAAIAAYVNGKVTVTVNGQAVTAKLAGIDPPQGFDPPWPILSIDKIWFVANFTYDAPERIREATVMARLFDAIQHHLNKGKMVRGDDEYAWLFNEPYRAVFEEAPAAAPQRNSAAPTPAAGGTSLSRSSASALPAPGDKSSSGGQAGPDVARSRADPAPAAVPAPVAFATPPSPAPSTASASVPAAAPAAPAPPRVASPAAPVVPAVPPSPRPPSESASRAAAAGNAASPVPGGPQPAWREGLRHALRPDHILFMMGLGLAAAGGRALVRWLAGYAAASALGIGLAALGSLRVQPALPEEIFALMLVYLGVENALVRDGDGRWLLAGFGALHGLGLGSQVAGPGPAAALGASWLAVTFGIAAAAFFLFRPLRRHGRFYRIAFVGAGSLLIAAVGVVLFIERAGGA